MSYNEPRPGFYEFDSKDDFVEFYADHKDCINEGIANGSLEVKFLDDVGDALVSAEPDNEGDLTEVIEILPDNIQVHVIKQD
ncbi:MAG: hypothetical protein Q4P18_06545 [Methanobrevibacter sp.]|uniref:hypothetical protein n=1 Tax=Methanobrevibacter sp. TaxID=66852 RepID=UPI0026DF6B63|nr:hypothetical protein [Methanobrevibacter sp.]MDO5849174.1 hypothetical protein [Methanobrevibacter sp.]